MTDSFTECVVNSLYETWEDFASYRDMRATVAEIKQLPLLSGVATRVLELQADPYADVAKLANIIEVDPILTTQLIHWAGSAAYGYQGKILSVNDAISRVLGFDFVLNLVFSLAVLKPLRMPVHGVIGARNLMLHALMSVQLMQALNQKMPEDQRLPKQNVYLVALTHNLGFHLFAHYFPNEFAFLNTLIERNPNSPIYKIEQFAFNIDHALFGSWLMQTWEIPQAIVNVIYQHHNPHYQGENFLLNQLTYLSDCLLAQIGIGDAAQQSCPEFIYSSLKLPSELCQVLLTEIQHKQQDTLSLVEQLVNP